MATSARQKVATMTGGLYYPEFILGIIFFSGKLIALLLFYKGGHINRLDILSVDILSGVYCISSI